MRGVVWVDNLSCYVDLTAGSRLPAFRALRDAPSHVMEPRGYLHMKDTRFTSYSLTSILVNDRASQMVSRDPRSSARYSVCILSLVMGWLHLLNGE